jgi:hypothetical protein
LWFDLTRLHRLCRARSLLGVSANNSQAVANDIRVDSALFQDFIDTSGEPVDRLACSLSGAGMKQKAT